MKIKMINEVGKLRVNSHQTHMESLVLLGNEGLDELNDKINNFKLRLANKENNLTTTQKIDGSPAVICWSKFEGYPDNSIQLKSFKNGPDKAMSSIEDIDRLYGDRPVMSKMLRYCLELARCIPEGEAWQGDCLFTAGSKKEQNIKGKDYITFQPNTIVYAYSEDNEGYEKVKDAEFGICFHTIYYPGDLGSKSQRFNVDLSKLSNVPSGIYVMSPHIKFDSKLFDTKKLDSANEKLLIAEEKLRDDPAYEEIVNNSKFMQFWNKFENSYLSDKQQVNLNTTTVIKDLKDFISNDLQTAYDKKLPTLKTDKGRANAKTKLDADSQELLELVDDNRDTINNIVEALNCAANVKMVMWDGFKKVDKGYSSFYQSRSQGFKDASMEGIAMSDSDGNIVKVVDRSSFSNANRDADIIKGFEHESLEEDMLKLTEDLDKRRRRFI